MRSQTFARPFIEYLEQRMHYSVTDPSRTVVPQPAPVSTLSSATSTVTRTAITANATSATQTATLSQFIGNQSNYVAIATNGLAPIATTSLVDNLTSTVQTSLTGNPNSLASVNSYTGVNAPTGVTSVLQSGGAPLAADGIFSSVAISGGQATDTTQAQLIQDVGL